MSIIHLDLDNSSIRLPIIEVKQGDTKELEIEIYKSNRIFDITGFDITINGLNQNGDGIVQTTDVIIDRDNGFKVTLGSIFTNVPGDVRLEAMMTKGDIRVTTFTFKMTVLKGLLQGANLKPTLVIDNIEILTNLIAEAKSIINK